MKVWHRGLVLLGGWVTFQLLVTVAGRLAAIGIPKAYFDFFRPNLPLALFIEETVMVATPLFLLSVAGCALTLYRFRQRLREAAAWCLGGTVLAWFISMVQGAVAFEQITPEALGLEQPPAHWKRSPGSYLLTYIVPSYWFQATVFYAPWAGFVAAMLWVRRSARLRAGSDVP